MEFRKYLEDFFSIGHTFKLDINGWIYTNISNFPIDLFLFRSYNTCHDASVVACAFTPDSTFIISGSSNGDLRVWDAKYGHGKVLTYTLEGHDLGVTSCDFSPHMKVKDSGVDGCITYEFATSGHDNLVKIWEMTADLSCTCKSLYKPFFVNSVHRFFPPLNSVHCTAHKLVADLIAKVKYIYNSTVTYVNMTVAQLPILEWLCNSLVLNITMQYQNNVHELAMH